MSNTTELHDLVAGYSAYAASEEIAFESASSEMASSPLCGFLASFAFSYLTTNGPGK